MFTSKCWILSSAKKGTFHNIKIIFKLLGPVNFFDGQGWGSTKKKMGKGRRGAKIRVVHFADMQRSKIENLPWYITSNCQNCSSLGGVKGFNSLKEEKLDLCFNFQLSFDLNYTLYFNLIIHLTLWTLLLSLYESFCQTAM